MKIKMQDFTLIFRYRIKILLIKIYILFELKKL